MLEQQPGDRQPLERADRPEELAQLVAVQAQVVPVDVDVAGERGERRVRHGHAQRSEHVVAAGAPGEQGQLAEAARKAAAERDPPRILPESREFFHPRTACHCRVLDVPLDETGDLRIDSLLEEPGSVGRLEQRSGCLSEKPEVGDDIDPGVLAKVSYRPWLRSSSASPASPRS